MTKLQTKRRPGRPAISDGESAQINVRLAQEQLDWLTDEARRQGGSGRTAVIRRLIEAEMVRTTRR